MNAFTGLNYITIGEDKRPIKFGCNQTAIFCQIRGITLAQYSKEWVKISSNEGDGSEVRDLIYSALAAGCLSVKMDVNFDKYDVGNWIDDADQAEIARVFTLITAQTSPNANGQSQKPPITEKIEN